MHIFWSRVIHALLVQLISEVSATRCSDDSEYTIQHPNGSEECFPCPSCPRGFGLQPSCGSYISPIVSLKCEPCTLGDTYSPYNDFNPCLPCAICAEHEKVAKNCTLYSNSKCTNKCDKGFYHSSVTADCQPCSWCCNDKDDEVVDNCKAKGMPAYKSCKVEQTLKCQPKCRPDQYILVISKSGKVTCRDCPTCPLGSGLVKKCGDIIEDPSLINCESCETGKTYSDEQSATQCKKCSTCSAEVVIKACATKIDTKCGSCVSGYYRNNATNRCFQCSYCCGDDLDVRVRECVRQGMPTEQQCLLTERSATVCHVKPARKNLSLGTIIGIVTASVVAVFLIFPVIYVMKKCKKRESEGYTKVDGIFIPGEEQGRTVTASVALQSTDVEWAVAHGSTETISFAKSGVKVEFTDSESYTDLSTNLAVEIYWDEKNFPQLKEGEILLSPVVRFHPHNRALTSLCCVKIPHTALLTGTRDPQLVLKRGVFEGDNCSWEDVPDSQFSVEATEVCFNTTKLQSYAVVGSGDAFKKRMQCAVFAGKEINADRFTADLCFIDDCEASQERIFQEERAKGRSLLGSWRAVYVGAANEDVDITVQTISEGWSVLETNPEAIGCASFLESYKNIPRSEITFHQGDTTKRDFQCSIVVENEREKIVVPVFFYFEKPRKKKQTKSTLQGLEQLIITENVIEDMSSDRISTLRLSDLSPTTLEAIQQLLKKEESDTKQVTVQLGVEETMCGSNGTTYLNVGERTKENAVDYLAGVNPNMTVGQFMQQLHKMDRVDVVQILMSYLHGATEV